MSKPAMSPAESIGRIIDHAALRHMRIDVETLTRLSSLFSAIADVEDASGHIVALARLGEDFAAQASESLGHAVEKMQGEHLPEILALVKEVNA